MKATCWRSLRISPRSSLRRTNGARIRASSVCLRCFPAFQRCLAQPPGQATILFSGGESMTSRRRAAALLCRCFFLNVSCQRSTKPRIAVVPKGQSHVFWQSIHAGAVKAGNEAGVEILWNDPPLETDYSRQIGIVEDFINQRVDGIVLAPSNGEAMVPVVDRAAQEH